MKRTEQADPLLLASETDALEALKSAVHSFEGATIAGRETFLYFGIHPFIPFRFFVAPSVLSVMVIGNFMLTV